jgi:hypothetical protein
MPVVYGLFLLLIELSLGGLFYGKIPIILPFNEFLSPLPLFELFSESNVLWLVVVSAVTAVLVVPFVPKIATSFLLLPTLNKF